MKLDFTVVFLIKNESPVIIAHQHEQKSRTKQASYQWNTVKTFCPSNLCGIQLEMKSCECPGG